jgi:hypothetical protein
MTLDRTAALLGMLSMFAVLTPHGFAAEKKSTSSSSSSSSSSTSSPSVSRPASAPVVRSAPAAAARTQPTPAATVRTQTAPAATVRTQPTPQQNQNAAIEAARKQTLENQRRQEQQAAALRAQQAAINKKRDEQAAALRAQQAAINKKRDEEAARRNATVRSGPSISSGPAAGYNTSNRNQVVIGSDRRTGGATPADRAAVDKIQADAKKLREQKQKPAN